MRRHLQLKREVLTALNTNELAQVAGGTVYIATVLLSGDICIRDTYVCITDTCPTDVDCGEITRYCLSRIGGGC